MIPEDDVLPPYAVYETYLDGSTADLVERFNDLKDAVSCATERLDKKRVILLNRRKVWPA
jgi:hypothetical protein